MIALKCIHVYIFKYKHATRKHNTFDIYQGKHNYNCILVALNSKYFSLVKSLQMLDVQ